MHCRIVPGEHALAEAGIARQPRLDLGDRLPPPCQQALAQNGLIHGQQQHEQVWITPARSWQMAAGAIDQDVLPRRQPVVDFPRDAIGQAIGVPAQGKRALRLHVGELLRSDTLRRLPYRFRRAGDDPPHHATAAIGQRHPCRLQQAVLA
ncbi:hypothetical protein D3C87_1474730 [compost metagenome]